MKKKALLIAFIFVILGLSGFSQTTMPSRPALDKSNPNYEHYRITYLWLDSQNEPVIREAITILKNRAFALKMPEAKMMRNQFIFRILENTKLTREDKLWAADFFIKASESDISYPVEYIKTLRYNLLVK